MNPRLVFRRHLIAVVVSSLAIASCGSDASSPSSTVDVPSTVAGVGSLPPLGLRPLGLADTPNTFPSGEPVPVRDETVGDVATGPRLLMIGDSILATVSRRYSNLACQELTPLGWQVSVEAEVGRAVEFGLRVLSEKMDETWHAAVVFLGTNYWRDQDQYEADLVKILDRLEPRPTVLLSVSEWGVGQREVNEVIADQVLTRDNVWFLDWKSISETPGVLSSDRIHPSDEGNELLVSLLAEVLGRAPGDEKGSCLPSEFVDDMRLPDGQEGPGAPSEDATETGGDGASSTTSAPVTSTRPGATTTLP